MKYTVEKDIALWSVFDGEEVVLQYASLSDCLAYITLKERGLFSE
jgi:hypothetical protein